RMAFEVLAALEAAHRAGLVHRDVKPANILLGLDGRARLTDFGVATVTGKEGLTVSGLQQFAEFAGTLAYMAPERARGEPVDARADVHALGLVLLEAIHGSLTRDVSVAPSAWRSLIARATAPDPRDRFASAAEMAGALSSLEDQDAPADVQDGARHELGLATTG